MSAYLSGIVTQFLGILGYGGETPTQTQTPTPVETPVEDPPKRTPKTETRGARQDPPVQTETVKAETTRTVEPKPPVLAWKATALTVAYAPGGFPLEPAWLARQVDNPSGLDLEFDPPAATALLRGQYTLKMRARDTATHGEAWKTMRLDVDKATVKLVSWRPGKVDWSADGVEIVDTMLQPRLEPAWPRLIFTPDLGDMLFDPGAHTLTVRVKDPNCEPATFVGTLEIKISSKDQRLLELQKQKEQASKDKPKAKGPDPETLRLRREAYEKLLKEDVPASQLTTEYPYGAANKTPHIHYYGGDFHLKTENGDRINLVQQGERREASIQEALDYALEYDERNARGKSPTRLRRVLQEMLK